MTLRVKIELLGARAPWRQARTDLIEEVKFARDSPLERKGFEPLVPVRANSCRHHPADCPTCFGAVAEERDWRILQSWRLTPRDAAAGVVVRIATRDRSAAECAQPWGTRPLKSGRARRARRNPASRGAPGQKRAPPAAGLKSSSAARGNEAARRETLLDWRQRAVNMLWASLCVFQGVDQRPVPSGLKVT
jgi:hypothetical protein